MKGVGNVNEIEGHPDEMLMEPGDRLAFRRGLIDRGEAEWLELLAEFDRHQLWQLDGQLSCVAWLMWRIGMSRGTAFEKLRIAHELSRRPAVAAALASGGISYSAVRAITRLDHPDRAVDEALVQLARVGTVRDLEQAVRRYQLCADQERAGGLGRTDRRGIRIHRGLDGYSSAEIILEDSELDELLGALRAATDHGRRGGPVDESPREDFGTGGATEGAVDESPREDSPAGGLIDPEALLDLVQTGLAHLGDGAVAGADRYIVHVLVDAATGAARTLDGTPLPPAVAGRIRCDASTVTHLLGSSGEPLALGRRSREWSTGQHRAISVRDGGTCRFPGCHNRITDIHHVRYWADGGATDIDNGVLLCRRHHTLTHEGFGALGDANDAVSFSRPDGSPIGATRPRIPSPTG